MSRGFGGSNRLDCVKGRGILHVAGTSISLYASNVYFLSGDPYHLAQEGWGGQTDGQK